MEKEYDAVQDIMRYIKDKLVENGYYVQSGNKLIDLQGDIMTPNHPIKRIESALKEMFSYSRKNEGQAGSQACEQFSIGRWPSSAEKFTHALD